jgi:hypothetical protein
MHEDDAKEAMKIKVSCFDRRSSETLGLEPRTGSCSGALGCLHDAKVLRFGRFAGTISYMYIFLTLLATQSVTECPSQLLL